MDKISQILSKNRENWVILVTGRDYRVSDKKKTLEFHLDVVAYIKSRRNKFHVTDANLDVVFRMRIFRWRHRFLLYSVAFFQFLKGFGRLISHGIYLNMLCFELISINSIRAIKAASRS